MLSLIFFVAATLGQSAEQAAQYYQDQDWEKAASAYRAIVEKEPENGRAWARLGLSLIALEKYEPAIEALEGAVKVGFIPQLAHYQLARAEALSGDASGAFTHLDHALEAGYANTAQLESDDAFAALETDARFEAALERAQRNATPCEYAAEFRQFDFWLGEWEVTAGGQPAGVNRIEKHENGCFLLENWTSVGGGSGKSMNFYDGADKKWHQVWVDSGGTSIFAHGGLRDDGAMHFEGEHLYPNGTRQLYKMTFTPNEDGTVRQYIEQSADGGESWNVWFDGLYSPKKP